MEKQIVFILIALSFFSCKKENRTDCFTSHGKETKEIREIGSYSVLKIEDHLNVTIKSGRSNQAEITCGKNILPLVQCEAIDDTLFIKNTATCNWVRNYDREIEVIIYVDTLDAIINHSSGKFATEDTIYNKGYLYVEGRSMNGEFSMNVVCNRMKFAFLNGSSTANFNGRVNIADFYNNGIGYIEATELTVADKTIINHKGTGELSVNAGDELRGWIYRTGNVNYTGNPKAINVTEYDTGHLVKIE